MSSNNCNYRKWVIILSCVLSQLELCSPKRAVLTRSPPQVSTRPQAGFVVWCATSGALGCTQFS
jgi:hypothetical protein